MELLATEKTMNKAGRGGTFNKRLNVLAHKLANKIQMMASKLSNAVYLIFINLLQTH